MRLSRRYPVPTDLALLYEFVNSVDLRHFVQQGVPHPTGDELATVPQLELWLRDRGLLDDTAQIDEVCLDKALKLRDSIRAFLGLSAAGRQVDGGAAADLNAAAAGFPLIVQLAPTGTPRLQPATGAACNGLGAIVAELQQAAATERLGRLKICDSGECRWAFFDRSKPGTRRWCDSTLCGNREKTRAYRSRQKQHHATFPG